MSANAVSSRMGSHATHNSQQGRPADYLLPQEKSPALLALIYYVVGDSLVELTRVELTRVELTRVELLG